MNDINGALSDVAASSHRGLAFLLAFGSCWLLCGILAHWLTPKKTALLVIFQGAVGLPLSFAFQRWLGFPKADPSNPLIPLLIYVAASQSIAIPVVLFMYKRMPTHVAPVFASILGAHFLPYVWLQQSRVYLVLSIAVSLGAWVVMAAFRGKGYAAVPLFVGACLLLAAARL
jgi:hypothetical protein